MMDAALDILVVSRCLPEPTVSGDRVILHHIARQLRARGHTLDLLAFHLPDEPTALPASDSPFRHIQVIPERRRSLWNYLTRLARPFPESAGRCWNPEMWKAVEDRLGHHRHDLVHFHGGVQVYEFRDLVVTLLPNLIVPYDSYSRQLDVALRSAPGLGERAGLRARLLLARRYESRIYRGFDRVVFVTHGDEVYLQQLTPGLRTSVIPNGVDGEYFRPDRTDRAASALVFVGNLRYSPNLEAAQSLATEILPRVRQEESRARAVIVGPTPPGRRRLLTAPDVDLTGWVPDIRPYLRRAACFVSPLSSGTGVRNKILEAMAMAVPVVATPLSCEGISVTDGENVLLGRTPDELAAAALRLIRDEDLGRRIGEAGRRLVLRDHTWGRAADRYEALYADVIAERSRSAIAIGNAR